MAKTQRNHIDLWTLFAVLTLMVVSLGVVYSASSTFAQYKWGESGKLLGSHALKVLLGFLAMLWLMHVDYHKYLRITKKVLVVVAAMLLLTLLLGGEANGAVRWLRFGGFSVQPSEFAKFALIFHLSVLIATKGERIRDLKAGLLPMLIWVGLVVALVFAQPNRSTGVMIFALSLVMLYAGKAKLSHIALICAALIPVLVAYVLSAKYAQARIAAFLGHGPHSTGKTNYQVWQGIIGFGNGGLIGLGPGVSRQRDFFLPESYGDFIFSIIGEEYGLVGTIFVLSLYVFILLRGMEIARNARDEFGRCLAVGITSAITLYALVNTGVTLGLMPTTGLPMPFVSYGGSSLLASSAAIGVLLNISSQTDMHPRLEQVQTPHQQPPAPAVGSVY